MALFRKKEQIGCVFLKEESSAAEELAQLSALPQTPEIEKQIKLIRYGEAGEQALSYELRSSGLDMYVIHDLFLDAGSGYTAQLDYLIVMEKAIVILECKNLIGDVTVDNRGAFTRSYMLGTRRIREGIYSPVTQNERHKRVLHDLLLQRQKGFLGRRFFEDRFENRVFTFVVLANPKTCLNTRYAPAALKNAVLRADQLVEKLRGIAKNSDNPAYSSEDMRELAEFFLSKHTENPIDYTARYVQAAEETASAPEAEPVVTDPVIPAAADVPGMQAEKTCPRCGAKLVLRTAKKGEHIGNQFWGCSGFPKCRYTEQIR